MDIPYNMLVRKAQQGDREAFAALYAHIAKELYSYALFVLCVQADAQDAVQEAVFTAWRELPSLRDPEKFKPWLFRILANLCRRQQSGKNPNRQTESLEALEQDAGFVPSFARDEPDIALSLTLRQALLCLQEQEKQIVLLSVLGGYKSHEIASVLQCSSGTVRSRLHRAFGKLRKVLEEQEQEKELYSS